MNKDTPDPNAAVLAYRALTCDADGSDDLMYLPDENRWFIRYPEGADHTKMANWYPIREDNVFRNLGKVLAYAYKKAAQTAKEAGFDPEYKSLMRMSRNAKKADFLTDVLNILKDGRGKDYYGIKEG